MDRSYDRGDRVEHVDRTPAPRRGSGEWSEVPPELEGATARAACQQGSRNHPAAPDGTVRRRDGTARLGRRCTCRAEAPDATKSTAASAKAAAPADASTDGAPAAPKRRTTRKAAGTDVDVPVTADAAPAAPKRRTTRKATGSAGADGEGGTGGAAPKAAPKARTPRKPASA